MQFIVFGPAFAEPGDDVSIVDDIKPGDFIQFVRLGPTSLELRHAGPRPEQCYRVERGQKPGTVALHAVAGSEAAGLPMPIGQLNGATHGSSSARGAELSACQTYRYRLWRIWDTSRPPVLFIGLNPSTADAEIDDPTIRRCMSFAREWGYGGIEMANLFAFRATDPRELLGVADPIGPGNDAVLHGLRGGVPTAVAAWGAHRIARERAHSLLQTMKPLHCLGITKNGHPRHPLYVKRGTTLAPWENPLAFPAMWGHLGRTNGRR